MSRTRIFAFCIFFVFVGFLGTAWSENLIRVNHFKQFQGGNFGSEFLKLNLVTPKKTRVQIMVTKQSQIIENHRLVVGPSGVSEGSNLGVQSWGCVLPGGVEGKDLEVAIFVQPLAGAGEPVRYEIKPFSPEDKPGFSLSSSAMR